jgi:hypothetical protein
LEIMVIVRPRAITKLWKISFSQKTSWVKISIKMRFYAIFTKKQYINYLDYFIIFFW